MRRRLYGCDFFVGAYSKKMSLGIFQKMVVRP
jgi:hypothetical protein